MSNNFEASIKDAIDLIDFALTKTRKRNVRAQLIALSLESLIDEFPEYTEMYLCDLIDHIKDTY